MNVPSIQFIPRSFPDYPANADPILGEESPATVSIPGNPSLNAGFPNDDFQSGETSCTVAGDWVLSKIERQEPIKTAMAT